MKLYLPEHGVIGIQECVVEATTADSATERPHISGTQCLASYGYRRVGSTPVEKNLICGVASSFGLRALLAGYLAIAVSIAIGWKISASVECCHMVAWTATSVVVGVGRRRVVARCHHRDSADGVALGVGAG